VDRHRRRRGVTQPAGSEVIEAWQCAGCRRIDAPRPCIGVCRDRRVRRVAAAELDGLSVRIEALEQQQARLAGFVATLAHVFPRPDGWERSFRELQRQKARVQLASIEAPGLPPG
jgi:hypothetical protein